MINLLRSLCGAQGSSGKEDQAAHFVAAELSYYAQVNTDHNGNVIATMGNPSASRHILLDAHLDQIGLIVTHIDDEGFIRAASCGGMDRRVLMGCRVQLCGKKNITGVVSCLPPHLTKGGEDSLPAMDQLAIDTGLPAEAVREIIQPGDRILFSSTFTQLLGQRISSPALDNRAGVAALIRCVQLLSGKELPCRLTILCSVQEETGGAGAKTAAYTLHPDEAIMVDVSFAQQPGVSPEKAAKLGEGTMIGISPTLSREITNRLMELAKAEDIPYQLEVMSGPTGTNADEVTGARGGIPGGLLSIPLRNMHTQAEIIDLRDVEATAQLLASYVAKGGLFHG